MMPVRSFVRRSDTDLTNFYAAAGSLIVTDSAEVATLYNPGDIAWTLASMALVWIMIPGLGYFYSGLLRRKNALSMIYLSMMTIAVVSFQVRPPFHRLLHFFNRPELSGSSGDSPWPSATVPINILAT
jgi:hypothetical protein